MASHKKATVRADKPMLDELLRNRFVGPMIARRQARDRAGFYRQLAALLRAGIALRQALAHMEAGAGSPRLRDVARAAGGRVQAGDRLSAVMGAYPSIFPELHAALIRVGEEGVGLVRALEELASLDEEEEALRRFVSRETLYPKIVFVLELIVLGPRTFIPSATQSDLVHIIIGPDPLRGLCDIGGFLAYVLFVSAVAVAVYRLAWFNLPNFRVVADNARLRIPWIAGIVRTYVVGRFIKVVAVLYRAGLPMGACVRLAGAASGSAVLEGQARAVAKRVDAGVSLSTAVADCGFFSQAQIAIFRTGEMTGELDSLLILCSDSSAEQARHSLHRLSIALGQAMLLIVAVEALLYGWL